MRKLHRELNGLDRRARVGRTEEALARRAALARMASHRSGSAGSDSGSQTSGGTHSVDSESDDDEGQEEGNRQSGSAHDHGSTRTPPRSAGATQQPHKTAMTHKPLQAAGSKQAATSSGAGGPGSAKPSPVPRKRDKSGGTAGDTGMHGWLKGCVRAAVVICMHVNACGWSAACRPGTPPQ
jgi:hypothetical protein